MLISRASEEHFVTVLAIGKKRVLGSLLMDAEEITLTVTSIGREVVILIFVDTVTKQIVTEILIL